jgi:hypothetical protein
MDLKKIAEDIRVCLERRRNELELSFIEEDHIYFMKDLNGEVRSDFPSVSKVYKHFYNGFDADAKSLQMAKGDVVKQQKLLEQWKAAGDYSTNMGSRVHFMLEKDLVNQYGDYKAVREPLFECDDEQMVKSEAMIGAGKNFLDLMHERGAVLLDTETVLGDPELGYTGQPDKFWLIMNKSKTDFGFLVTDWKTNKPKNFKVQPWTDRMLHPFQNYMNTALSHYYLQLPFYARLLLKMLQGTEYGNKKLLGCIVVLLKEDGTYEEFRVPQEINHAVLNIDIVKYLTK